MLGTSTQLRLGCSRHLVRDFLAGNTEIAPLSANREGEPAAARSQRGLIRFVDVDSLGYVGLNGGATRR